MLYRIVSDIPGRLRLRCGAFLISDAEGRGVAHALLAVEGVGTAEVHPANGSILVTYEPGDAPARAAALAVVARLDVLDLPEAEPGVDADSVAIDLAAENNRFARRATNVVVWQLLRRVLLPAPLRAVWTCIRAVGFVARGLAHLARGELTVEVLDALAITMSIVTGSFSEASTIIFLLTLSGVVEEHVQSRTRLTLRGNVVTRAEAVWLVDERGQDVRIPVDEVREGQVLHLGMGQVLPVDGTVVEGTAEIDESSMTGESRPVTKAVGSTVFAGTALGTGDLKVRVTARPGLARIDAIVKMVEDSSELKAGVQGKAERLADGLVPYNLAAFFIIWAISRRLSTAMAVLMVDYSCAIKFATPVAVMSAMSEATRHGIVVKGGKYLEALAAADTIVFDKTGTLTHASPQVERVFSYDGTPEDELLRLAACVEEHFPHSTARAIVEEAARRGLGHETELHAQVSYIVAHGIATTVGGKRTVIGSSHFVFEDEGVKMPRPFLTAAHRSCPTASFVYLAMDGRLVGSIAISDPVRAEAPEVLARLRSLGFEHLVMLTGDSEHCARYVAQSLAIDSYHSQVLPEDKSRFVQELRDEGHTVLMVGDGVNDSPALAAADVSLAMSDASDIARAVADVSANESSLGAIVTARLIAQRLMARIRADYRFIVGFNSTLIMLGVAGVLPATTTAYLHNGSTFLVTALSARPLLRSERAERRARLLEAAGEDVDAALATAPAGGDETASRA